MAVVEESDSPTYAISWHQSCQKVWAGENTKIYSEVTRHAHLVRRAFSLNAPSGLWVSGLTLVTTWAVVVYAFSRMIVGQRAAAHMKIETVLDWFERAKWSTGMDLCGLERY